MFATLMDVLELCGGSGSDSPVSLAAFACRCAVSKFPSEISTPPPKAWFLFNLTLDPGSLGRVAGSMAN